jgi:hypothetical protein
MSHEFDDQGGSTMTRLRIGVRTLAVLLALAALPLRAQTAVGTGAFPDVRAVETQLKRGSSTKADVQRVLGVPTGTGHSAGAPPGPRLALGPGPRELWLYDDMELRDLKRDEGPDAPTQTLRGTFRQQILLVFFKEGIFDGYLWTSSEATTIVD